MATDPNVDSEYVGLSPLSLDDIRNFFDSYIKPYAPYREEKVYNTLINTLSEYTKMLILKPQRFIISY